jgi:hypothetical protein
MIFYNRRTPLIAIVSLSVTAILFCPGKRAAHATLLQSGLLNYWRLNEGFGSVANDTGPSGTVADNGTLRGNPTWVNGIFNAGLEFSGAAPAQDVLIPNSADMNIGGANAVTLSTWVKLGVLPGAAMTNNFASIFDAANDGYVMYLDKTNQELRFKTTDNNGVSTGAHPGIPASLLNTTDWFHVMGVYDGSQGAVKIYLNGNLVDTGSMPTVVQTVRSGQITGMGAEPTAAAGNPASATTLFPGRIADVAVWNRPLGGAEAQYLYNSGTGNAVGASNPDIAPLPTLAPSVPSAQPVIYYSLNGDVKNYGSGGAALDATFNDGPDAAGPQYASSTVGQGLDLRGNPTATNTTATNGDYLSANYVLTDRGTISMNFQDMTWFDFNTLWGNSANANAWEAWIYGSASAPPGRLASRMNEGSGNNNLDFFLPLTGANAQAAPHHVAFTWDRNGTTSQNKIYVDGILREQFVETWRAPGTTFYIGGGTGNQLGKGIYDEVRVYDVPLSASEVLYLSQVPEPATLSVVAIALVVCSSFVRRTASRRA